MADRELGFTLESCLNILNTNTAHPEIFLSVQDVLASDFTSLTKTLYDLHKAQEPPGAVGSPLKELVVENFDEEQIWQELELQNTAVLAQFQKAVGLALQDKEIGFDEAEEEDREDGGSEEESAAELSGELGGEDSDEDGSVQEEEEEERRASKPRKASAKSEALENFNDEDSDVDFDVDALERQTKRASERTRRPGGGVGSVVDDRFFKLADMEAFLEAVENKEQQGDEGDGEVDYFEEILSEEEEELGLEQKTAGRKKGKQQKSSRDLKYKDFFDPVEADVGQKGPNEDDEDLGSEEEIDEEMEDEDMEEEEDMDEIEDNEESRQAKEAFKRVTFNLSDDSEGEEVESILGGKQPSSEKAEPKSSFEKRQEKMAQRIRELEKAALEEKPWQLTGEVSAQKRPENSLLEEDLMFEQAARMAPVITEETTLLLDDIIKQRIKDQAWDDVIRKEKPKEDAFEYKKRLTLDHEKSKLSLAEVYEQEYLKQTQQKKEEEENPAHAEIQKLMDCLFLKLDGLSNFRFTPRPPVPEVKIVSNLPSIAMEEVAPVSVSDATLLAPEEIKEKNKAGDVVGESERTATDRKRERRKKKLLKRIRLKKKEKWQKPGEQAQAGDKKLSKAQATEQLKKVTKGGKAALLKDEGKDKALRSSQAFFSELQDQVKMQIKGAKNQVAKKSRRKEVSASKLKL
ncbi:U3 small nucleolar ribonucleoprotein protein MPP10 [Lepisosteus oculatus]|uniref:U3 small nucleolar ribonucleoprotein protein MPP10 n=1 Tax=Lepisosteus oculatus TaxID=7918 RepID=UPI003712FF31